MLTMFRIARDKTIPKSDGSELPLPTGATSMCRLATGRSALFHLIKRIPEPYVSTVLLPAYIAEGVILPFLTAGLTVRFYRINNDLSPRAEDVNALLEQVNGAALFVLIHYFGFPARSLELSAVLNRYRPIVVEDCAHAMFTTMPDGQPLSQNADFTLYSLNKFLPVVDGAILLSRRPDIDLSIDENSLPELPVEVEKAYQSHLQAGRDLFNCNEPTQANCFLGKLGSFYEQYYTVINADLSPFRQSARSRCIEDNFPYDSLVKQRLLNSHILYEELKSPVFSLVHQKMPLGVVPWCIPAGVPADRRTEIINSLFANGILLSTLRDKWDFIPAERSDYFEFESKFLDEHVLIPVSEFITADSMRLMVEQLNHV